MKTRASVAATLERELDSTIKEWLRRVNLVSELTKVPLSDAERTGHLPQLFADLVCRLRGAGDAEPARFPRSSRSRQSTVCTRLLCRHAS